MKTKLTVLLLFISLSTMAQEDLHVGMSVGAGLTSQDGKGTFKAALETCKLGWGNMELSVAVSGNRELINGGQWYEVYGAQTGYLFSLKHTSLRVAGGLFYHTALLPKTEDERKPVLRPGGSLRWQRRFGAFSFATDGQAAQMKLEVLLFFKLKR